jgi:hypothetical protein
LLSRLAGNMVTLTALLLGMSFVFALELRGYGLEMKASYVAALGGLWVEVLLLSSVGLAMSSFSSQIVSSVVTLSLYFAGHLAEDLYQLAARSKVQAVQLAGRCAYYALPNLERVNFRGFATYDLPVTWSAWASGALYIAAYSMVVIAVGVMIFQRRDFK